MSPVARAVPEAVAEGLAIAKTVEVPAALQTSKAYTRLRNSTNLCLASSINRIRMPKAKVGRAFSRTIAHLHW